MVPWVQDTDPDARSLLDVRVGTANNAGDPVSFTSYRPYRIGRTSKLDFRRLGRWGSIGFRCETPGVQLSGVEIEVNTANKR